MAWGGVKAKIREAGSGATPSRVTDLTITVDGLTAIDLSSSQPTNTTYEDFRYRHDGAVAWSSPLRLVDTATPSISLHNDGHTYEGQVRGTGPGGRRGEWSNTATFTVPDGGEEQAEFYESLVRRSYAGAVGGAELYSHALAVVASSVNEGSPVQWDYTLTKNGGTNETYTIRVRSQLPGYAPAYTQTLAEACAAVSEAGVTFIGNGTPTDCTFSINPALFDGTFRISRNTLNNADNQGAITSISQGANATVTTPVAHGLSRDQAVIFTTDGALPAPLVAGTVYYVGQNTDTTFKILPTYEGDTSTQITTTNAGSGTHRMHLVAGLFIEFVSAGTNNTPTNEELIKITDTYTSASATLSYLTISADVLDAPNVNTGVPVATLGTRVGEILGWDVSDVAVALSSVSLTNNVGGRFKITQETTHFYLDVDSGGPIDFLTTSGADRKPIMFYTPSISALDAAAAPATLSPNIRARYPKVEPTGDGTATVLTQDTIAELYTTFAATGDNKTVQISSAWLGVAQQTATSQPKLARSNATYIGHPRWAMRHVRGIVFKQGSNIIVKDWAFRVDGTYALITSTPAYKEIDNLMLSYAGTGMLRNVQFINCSFSTSNDELCRVKGNLGFFVQGARFTNCLFARPLYNSGHPKGAPHNKGPAVSPGNSNVVFENCLILDCSTRSPLVNRATGFTMRNCLVQGWYETASYGGTILNQGAVGAGTFEILTARVEANLYHPSAINRSNAITLRGTSNTNTAYCYIPSTGNYRNYFVNIGAGTYTDDPLTVGDGIALDDGAVAGVIRDTAPYELADDYDILPTATAQNREDLADRILDYVGVRERVGGVHTGALIAGDDALNAFDYDVVHAFRTGAAMDNTYTPTEVDAQWGSVWNGGGTKGAGMADEAPF